MDRTIAWTPTRAAALPATVLASPAAFAGYSLAPYVNYPAGNWAEAVAIGDVNGDGRNDAVLTTAAYDNYNTYIYLQSPDGTLATPVKTPYFSSANRNGLVLGDLTTMAATTSSLATSRASPSRAGTVPQWAGRLADARGDLSAGGQAMQISVTPVTSAARGRMHSTETILRLPSQSEAGGALRRSRTQFDRLYGAEHSLIASDWRKYSFADARAASLISSCHTMELHSR